MAPIATLVNMLTFERETGSGVIKMCFVPSDWGMTIATWILPEGIAVRVLISMTRGACRVDWLVVTVSVAFTAVDLTMFPFQGKAAHGVMIKSHVLGFKALSLVAPIAIVSRELTTVSVLVTAIATLTRWVPFFP